jgi:hypothetical protein
LQGGLLARRAGVHVDFHPNRDFNDLRCSPGHFHFSNVAARLPNEAKLRPSFERRKLALSSCAVFHLKMLRRISEWLWAAFHKFGTGAAQGRGYSRRHTTVGI